MTSRIMFLLHLLLLFLLLLVLFQGAHTLKNNNFKGFKGIFYALVHADGFADKTGKCSLVAE